jgi:hypothetical protein
MHSNLTATSVGHKQYHKPVVDNLRWSRASVRTVRAHATDLAVTHRQTSVPPRISRITRRRERMIVFAREASPTPLALGMTTIRPGSALPKPCLNQTPQREAESRAQRENAAGRPSIIRLRLCPRSNGGRLIKVESLPIQHAVGVLRACGQLRRLPLRTGGFKGLATAYRWWQLVIGSCCSKACLLP